jgi:hypothetical protein
MDKGDHWKYIFQSEAELIEPTKWKANIGNWNRYTVSSKVTYWSYKEKVDLLNIQIGPTSKSIRAESHRNREF